MPLSVDEYLAQKRGSPQRLSVDDYLAQKRNVSPETSPEMGLNTKPDPLTSIFETLSMAGVGHPNLGFRAVANAPKNIIEVVGAQTQLSPFQAVNKGIPILDALFRTAIRGDAKPLAETAVKDPRILSTIPTSIGQVGRQTKENIAGLGEHIGGYIKDPIKQVTEQPGQALMDVAMLATGILPFLPKGKPAPLLKPLAPDIIDTMLPKKRVMEESRGSFGMLEELPVKKPVPFADLLEPKVQSSDVIGQLKTYPISVDDYYVAEHGKPTKFRAYRGEGGGEYIPKLSPYQQGEFGRETLLGKGTYFTPQKGYAKHFGKVSEVEVSLNNPYVIENATPTKLRAINPEALKKQGYDGIIIQSGSAGRGRESIIQGIAFNPQSVAKAVKIKPTPNLLEPKAPDIIDTMLPKKVEPVAPKLEAIVPQAAPFKNIEQPEIVNKVAPPLTSESGAIVNPLGDMLPKTELKDFRNVPLPEKVKDLGITSKLRTPTNLMGAIPGQKATYGEAAAQAQRIMALKERDIKIQYGQRKQAVESIIKSVHKDDFGLEGEKFYDAFANRPIKEIMADPKLRPSTKEAAYKLREMMDRDRADIIKTKRDELQSWMPKQIEQEYRIENNLRGQRLAGTEHEGKIAAEVEKRIKVLIPDNWGIEDYLPQIHSGDYRIFYKGEYVGSAENKFNVRGKIMQLAEQEIKAGEKLTPEDFRVDRREFHDPDVVRLTNKRYHAIVNELAKEAEVTKQDIGEVLSGKIGTKEGRKKWAFFMQKREGVQGYRKDIKNVLDIYNRTFVRWKNLTELNRQFEPLVQKVKAEGRQNVASYLEANKAILWGQQSEFSRAFDNSMSKMPLIGKHIRPFTLERWTNNFIKTPITAGLLKLNPRFNVLNRLQTFQTLLPDVNTSEFIAGRRLYNSAEGKAILKKYGIGYLTGGKIAEGGGRSITGMGLREKMRGFAPETFNQEVSYLTYFEKARKMGMAEDAANDFAFLKGNVRSQFLHLRSDVPVAMRGPVKSTMFMYKRFPVKAIELGLDLVKDRNYPGVAKYMGAQILLGGAKLATSPLKALPLAGYLTYEMYKKLQNEYGDTVADGVMYGLPGLIGMDWSYSVQLIDMPYGNSLPERVGNFVLGPPGSIAIGVGSSVMDTKGTEPEAWKRGARAIAQRFPAMRWIETIPMIMNDKYDFTSPSGKLKFKTDLRGALTYAFGSRTTEQARDDMLIDSMTEVKGARDKSLDEAAQWWMKNDKARTNYIMGEWNELWPEFPITLSDVTTRQKARVKTTELPLLDRLLKQSGSEFKNYK